MKELWHFSVYKTWGLAFISFTTRSTMMTLLRNDQRNKSFVYAMENFSYWVEPRTVCWKYVLFSDHVKNISKHAAAGDSHSKYTKGHICWATLPTVMTFVAKCSFLHRRLKFCPQNPFKMLNIKVNIDVVYVKFCNGSRNRNIYFFTRFSILTSSACALSDIFRQEYLDMFAILFL